jgi:hypothetical protein
MMEHCPKGCKLASQWCIPFSALGSIQGHKVQHLLSSLGQIQNMFFYFSLDPRVKPSGPISTFAPIGMLDLG